MFWYPDAQATDEQVGVCRFSSHDIIIVVVVVVTVVVFCQGPMHPKR